MKETSHIRNASGERLDVAFHGGTKPGAIVVLGHGVTGNKDRPLIVALANGLAERGWSCLRISFSGNGESEGIFAESTITKEIEDLGSVFAAVPQEKRIAYIGHSMGAAVGVLTAATGLNIQALVSLAGMVRTEDFLNREFGDVVPGKGFMWDEEECPLSKEFSKDMKRIGHTLDEAAEVMQPWLLIHGTADDVVPLEESRDAFAAARCQKELLEVRGAGHVFGEDSYPKIISVIDTFLAKHIG